jgi:hypothetical protein
MRDGAEDPKVLHRQPCAMGLDEACPVLANDVGHLEVIELVWRTVKIYLAKRSTAWM